MGTRSASWLVMAVCCLALAGGRAGAQELTQWQRYVEDAKQRRLEKDYDGSERLLRRALDEAEKFGPEDSRLALTLYNLGNLRAALGDYPGAEPFYQRALTILEKNPGRQHSQLAIAHLGLADLDAAQKKYAEAEPHYQRCLILFQGLLGAQHPIVATVLERYAVLLRQTNRAAEAEQYEAQVKEIRTRHLAATTPH